MANATKYVDNVNGNNANTGDSEAQAYADIATAQAAISGGGNKIYVQNTGTSYPPFTCSAVADLTDGPNRIEGYTTTPGARDGRPTITSATNSAALITCSVDWWEFAHLNLTHTATTRGPVLSGGAADDMLFIDLTASGCSQWLGSANSNNNLRFVACRIDSFTSSSSLIPGSATSNGNSITMSGCIVSNNAGPLTSKATTSGVGNLRLNRCIFYNNIGTYLASFTSSAAAVHRIEAINCVFAKCSGGVFEISNTNTSPVILLLASNIFWDNGGYAINAGPSAAAVKAGIFLNRNNAYGSHTSGPLNNFPAGLGDVALSGNPFTDAASGDFSLDNTSGEGAACRAAGFLGLFPGGLTTGYPDIGAAQHQDAGGSGPVGRATIIQNIGTY